MNRYKTFFPLFNFNHDSTQDMVKKLQSLKGRTKMKLHQIISNYDDELTCKRQSGTFQFEEFPFGKHFQSIT